jgi:cation diffusion facilitator family transporter
MTKLRASLSNPFVVMALVVVMYVLKAIVKITIGSHINSPMIAGDGFHNVADILEALAVVAVIFVARRPASKEYPFVRQNIEFFASLAIGIALLVLGVQFAVKSLAGLLAYAPAWDHAVRAFLPLPDQEPLVMSPETFPVVLAITAGSVLLSLIVSRYQIAVGKHTGHSSLIADGEETASDSRIEMLTLVGVLGEYMFGVPWLEYPLGLLVAGFIAHTGWELFSSAFGVLLQRSIGEQHESEINRRCLAVCGVDGITSLKTFQVGQTCVCMLTIATRHGGDTVGYIKYGIEQQLRRYLLGEAGFKHLEVQLYIEKPSPVRHRIAYALVWQHGTWAVAETLADATHICVCDVEHGNIVLSRADAVPEDIEEFLVRKRVQRLYVFADKPPQLARVKVESATTFIPELLGFAGPSQAAPVKIAGE